jgi:DNA-binding transcriptional regulator YdaS (Cro superfamily)
MIGVTRGSFLGAGATEPSALDLAILKLGGQIRLARVCDVTPQAVSQWVRNRKAPSKHILAIEAATGVSRHDLRPDIFGPPSTNPAAGQGSAAV